MAGATAGAVGLGPSRGNTFYWHFSRSRPDPEAGADKPSGSDPGGVGLWCLSLWIEPRGQHPKAGAVMRGCHLLLPGVLAKDCNPTPRPHQEPGITGGASLDYSGFLSG
jgi:hypothetical protein